MRHIITGGSGLTGTALAKQLAKKQANVVIFDIRQPLPGSVPSSVGFVQGDITRPETLGALRLGGQDIVYHLAARQFADGVPSRDRDTWFASVNAEGTRNVLQAMRAGGAYRLIYFSTDMTYGLPSDCPVKPAHPQNPLGPYGRSKLQAELLLRQAEGLRATIFRPRLITGPGRLGILGKLFRLIRASLPVPMIGAGTNRYQMVGVEDCVRAAILATEAGCPPGPFNLGSETPPTTRELLQAIIAHARSRSILLPLPAWPLKKVLAALDLAGLTLLYPEQFSIADHDILLDTADTRRVLKWSPQHGDIEMMTAAYDAYCRGKSSASAAISSAPA
jgi:dTDP-glucose 4,6-dehydratase